LQNLLPKRSLTGLFFATLLLALLCPTIEFVKSDTAGLPYPNIQVNRVIQSDSGGILIMNDTVTLSANVSQNVASLTRFQIGLPTEYGRSLAYFFAYDASGRLQTAWGTYSNRTEFGWIDTSFPQPVNVSDGGSYSFTVVYVFSGLVKATGASTFRIDFPLYPSLTETAGICNVTVMLPLGSALSSSSSGFSNKTVDSRRILNNETSLLPTFAGSSSWVTFTASDFQILEVNEMKREIRIDAWGKPTVTDFYQITNRAISSLTYVSLALPLDAETVSVQDIYGVLTSGVTVTTKAKYTEVKVNLPSSIQTGDKVKLLVTYSLPADKVITRNGWQDYALNVSLTRPDVLVIKTFSVAVYLPEGASFQSATKTPSQVTKDVFAQTVNFYDYNVTRFHNSSFNLKYQYLFLWAAFRPTLWIGTGAAIVVVALFFMRKPKQVAVTPVSTGILRKFVDTYEEKRRIKREQEALEQQVLKKKISRRQYKLRRSSLDGRMSKLQKDLVEIRRETEGIRGQYAERMKQLEVAEAEIETLDRDIERVDARFRRHELSTEAHKKLVNEYNRRKEQAENTIAESLLRLREGFR